MKVTFVALNEINFDIVAEYIEKGYKLPYFSKIINDWHYRRTDANEEYRNLEPWIQWVSIHTGKKFSEHKIFRLGDIVKNTELKQIFEKLEEKGKKIGVISAMNASNKMKNPCYFIPDPWTDTATDGSAFSKRIQRMLSQTVNDNSKGKISVVSILAILEILIKTTRIRDLKGFIKLIFKLNHARYLKSIVLDRLIVQLANYLNKIHNPDLSWIFLNSIAHIQHHYMLNSAVLNGAKNPSWYLQSNVDPLFEAFEEYDAMLGMIIESNQDRQIIISTGLTQIPYDAVKYYYRLREHQNFLSKLKIKFIRVLPRMTRDFEIEFENENDLQNAKNVLADLRVQNGGETIETEMFGDIERNSKNTLFVTLLYPFEVTDDDFVHVNNEKVFIKKFLTFVALKNGKHSSNGFMYFKRKPISQPDKIISVESIDQIIIKEVMQGD